MSDVPIDGSTLSANDHRSIQDGAVVHTALAQLFERHQLPSIITIEPTAPELWDDALLVNGELIVRLSSPVVEPVILAKEAMIYRRLRRSTDVPCPEVLALDATEALLSATVLVHTRPAGVRGDIVWSSLSIPEREALSEEAGRIIGAVHGLKWSAYGHFDLTLGAFVGFPRWTDQLLARVEVSSLQAVVAEALPQPVIDSVVTQINDGDAVLATASPPVLVHGDLHTHQLFLEQQDGRWHITSIVGWRTALTADAAWEFALLAFHRQEKNRLGEDLLYGYRERHPVQADLRARIHLYRLLLQLEGATERRLAGDEAGRSAREMTLRRLLTH